MLSKLPTWALIVIIFVCLVTIVLIFSYHRVHAQEKGPETTPPTADFHFHIAQVGEDGEKNWVELTPKMDIKLYCYNGQHYLPCVIDDADSERGILALGPMKVDDQQPEQPEQKDDEMHSAER